MQLLLLQNECSYFLGRVIWHWACHQGAIWSALSDAVEFGVQNGILTETIKQLWWTFSNFMKLKCWFWSWKYDFWLFLAQLYRFLLIKISSRPVDESRVHSTPYFYCLSVILRHIWLTFFLFHILTLKSECYWLGRQKSWCSCHCLSKCIRSWRMRSNTLGNPHCHNAILFQEMLYHQWPWYRED